jgi:pimeloyl-ACP methyl ester carboxylesterase
MIYMHAFGVIMSSHIRLIFLANFLLMTFCFGASAVEPRYIHKVERSKTIIVFVHGIFGDSRKTWTGSGGSYFPELVARDPQFAGVSVYTYEYPTSFSNAAFSIDEIAENLRLYLEVDDVSSHENIVFIAHSMGGLVTRAYLLKNREVAARTRLIYFFSTPTTGSEIAAIGSLVLSNPQLTKMKPMNSAEYLADLQRQWLAAQFKIPSYCAYELRKTIGVDVVTQASATNLCTKRLDPIDADHLSIVKPAGDRDVPFLAFKSAFKQSMTPETPAQPPGTIRRSTLQVPDEEMRAVSAGLIESYTIILNVSIVNRDRRFAKLDFNQTFQDVSSQFKLLNGQPSYAEARLMRCEGVSERQANCLVRLDFLAAPIGDLALRVGPLVVHHRLTEDMFDWRRIEVRGRREVPVPWYLATAEMDYQIDLIDWIVASDGELLSGDKNDSILRFSVTNLSDQSQSIRWMYIKAGKDTPPGVTCGRGSDPTRVYFDWQKIATGKRGGVSADISGVRIPSRVDLYTRVCAGGPVLFADFPLTEEVAPNSTKQIGIRISEILVPSTIQSKGGLPKRLDEWPDIYFKVEVSGGVEVWPRVVGIRNGKRTLR